MVEVVKQNETEGWLSRVLEEMEGDEESLEEATLAAGRQGEEAQETEETLYSVENLSKLQQEASEKGYGCLRCRFTGWVPVFGKRTKCSCQMGVANGKEKSKPTSINVTAALASSEVAVVRGVIPKERANDEFDAEMARFKIDSLAQSSKALGCPNRDGYLAQLNEILVAISNGTLDRSYVLGAPTGCGKTTFVMTCLKRLVNSGKKCVPYKSLTELAVIQRESLTAVGSKTMNIGPTIQAEKKPESVPDFKWKDYLEADVLFTYLTNYEAALTELSVLKAILYSRGITGKPTIVMTSSTVKMYETSPSLKPLFWGDIFLYDNSIKTVKRLKHVSTWFSYPRKAINPKMQSKEGVDF